MTKFEYQILQSQNAAVTFVNGQWQGEGSPQQATEAADPLAGCPVLWDYLDQAGEQGWELIASSPHPREGVTVEVLYLKKEKFG